jgi:UDP-N-acetylmuramoyl-L-alanyl-D-glutamate--2,6-diaminopimelate ligase
MTLGRLLASLNQAMPRDAARLLGDTSALTRQVKAVSYDSRKTGAGALFFALKGQRFDGAAFAAQALARGATAVVAEVEPPQGVAAPWIVVSDARRALAIAADALYGHPSGEMRVVGITGTNGKTTTAYLIGAAFEAAGIPAGILGTIAYRIGREEREASRTTPEAPDVQQFLREMVDRGCRACAMEVSSHALVLRRVDGTAFAAAVFTNLTRDHLDFHHDMESYFAAKRRLFEMLPAGAPGILNADDPRSASLAGLVNRSVTYAIDRPADVRPRTLSLSLSGLSLDIETPRGPIRIESRLVGRPNVYNLLAAAATGVTLDLPAGAVEHGLASVAHVPGRFQVVSGRDDDITVVVDYAHTDDALKNLLETSRPLATHQLITVFGCGGDRDRTKRPLMGAVAARLSDVVVITSDNPRSEDPASIIEEIRRGIVQPGDRGRPAEPSRNGPRPAGSAGSATPTCLSIVDRRSAIEKAIAMARADDVVLIAGKGHERQQVIGDRVLPFDDCEVAVEALTRRRAEQGRS